MRLLPIVLTLIVLSLSTARSFAQSPVQSAVRLVNFKVAVENNKALLQWEATDNGNAYQFEVEKSYDGRNFEMTALVFGTDKADTDHYMFYEKAGDKKVSYRIKVVSKDKQAVYSEVIVIGNSTNI
jgi:hypothetical protein